MAHELWTARLGLAPLSAADAPALHELWTDPAVRRYLWDDVAIPRERTDAIVAGSEDRFERLGHGLWAVRLESDPMLAGVAGLWAFHEPPRLELIFCVASARWGRGIATEAADAVLRHVFDDLEHARVEASTDAPNAASVRVLEKLGMRFVRSQILGGRDTLVFALPRPDWEALRCTDLDARPLVHLSEPERAAVLRYVRLLRERLGAGVEEIRLFGSAARGDMWSPRMPIHSDIDLLVVTREPASGETIEVLVDATYPLFLACGRQISPQFRTSAELREPTSDRAREFAGRVAAEGRRIHLAPPLGG